MRFNRSCAISSICLPHGEAARRRGLGVGFGKLRMVFLEAGAVKACAGVGRPCDFESASQQGFFFAHTGDRFCISDDEAMFLKRLQMRKKHAADGNVALTLGRLRSAYVRLVLSKGDIALNMDQF